MTLVKTPKHALNQIWPSHKKEEPFFVEINIKLKKDQGSLLTFFAITPPVRVCAYVRARVFCTVFRVCVNVTFHLTSFRKKTQLFNSIVCLCVPTTLRMFYRLTPWYVYESSALCWVCCVFIGQIHKMK